MKLPNGYGTISKLSGARRKPYIVKAKERLVFDEKIKGYKKYRPVIGYAATKKEALAMMVFQNLL